MDWSRSRIGPLVTPLLIVALTLGWSTSTAAHSSRATVTASVSKTTLVIGQKSSVSGAVTPGKSGLKVALQLKRGKTWSTVTTKKTTAGGHYTMKVNPAAPGTLIYRVAKLPGRRGAVVYSPTFKVNVYRWHNVSDMEFVDSETEEYDETVNINGDPFPHSFTLDADDSSVGFFELNVNRKCSTFKAALGVWDESTTGAVAGTEVSGDGNLLQEGSYGLGEVDKVSLNIDNVLRLRVSAVALQDEVVADIAVGTPRVLCRF